MSFLNYNKDEKLEFNYKKKFCNIEVKARRNSARSLMLNLNPRVAITPL